MNKLKIWIILKLRILIWYRMYLLYVFWKLLIGYELFCRTKPYWIWCMVRWKYRPYRLIDLFRL